MQASQQSGMIDQRKNNGLPINFEVANASKKLAPQDQVLDQQQSMGMEETDRTEVTEGTEVTEEVNSQQ